MNFHRRNMVKYIASYKNDDRYKKHIEPYMGGDELNHSPELTHHRYVINLDDLKFDFDYKGLCCY